MNNSGYIKYFWKESIVDRLNRHGIHFLQFSDERIKKYANREVVSKNETNCRIYSMIMSGKPFLVSRLGGCETEYVSSFLGRSSKHKEKALDMMCTNAGFFPHDMDMCNRYAILYLDCLNQIDICGIWRYFMEDYLIREYSPNSVLTILEYLEPWRTANNMIPWSAALRGKKVLVVHPFAESIELQYRNKREKIWNNCGRGDEILPDFKLITLKAVQSMGGNGANGYGNWFEALEYMTEKVKEIDFDIAIVGCGAYGLPLSTRIKRLGKPVIHLAGATQLMFGIMGERWKKDDEISKYVNEYWVRPSSTETPNYAKTIENGCYW